MEVNVEESSYQGNMLYSAKTTENHYVTEEELKEELLKLQGSAALKKLKLLEDPSAEDLEEIQRLKQEGFTENYSKEKFGNMIMLIVNRLLSRSNFAGYTNNWKTDFMSNAIEKILLYAINNFDASMISKRSGENVKAFAYVTQIAKNAFLEIINSRKEEEKLTRDVLLPLDEYYFTVKNVMGSHVSFEEEKDKPNLILCEIIDDDSEMLKLMKGRGLDVLVVQEDIELEESCTNIAVIKDDKITQILKMYSTDTLVSVLKQLDLDPKKDKIDFTYPKDYRISVDEFEQIKELHFDFLNIHRYDDSYKPSFPKKTKKDKEYLLDLWEEEGFGDNT